MKNPGSISPDYSMMRLLREGWRVEYVEIAPDRSCAYIYFTRKLHPWRMDWWRALFGAASKESGTPKPYYIMKQPTRE